MLATVLKISGKHYDALRHAQLCQKIIGFDTKKICFSKDINENQTHQPLIESEENIQGLEENESNIEYLEENESSTDLESDIPSKKLSPRDLLQLKNLFEELQIYAPGLIENRSNSSGKCNQGQPKKRSNKASIMTGRVILS